MALKRTLEKAEHASLDAALKAEYIEREGKFVLNVDGEMAALESERQRAKQLEAKLAGYGDQTPEQVKALNEAKAKAEREKDFAAGNFEKILAEERAKHGKDLELKDADTKRLRETLKSALIDAEAVRALAEHGGSPDLLLPIIQGRSKLETVGEREVAVVIGEKGGPLLKVGAQKADDYMPISEYVATVLKPDKRFAGAFAAGVGSGSGGPRTGPARPAGSSIRPSTAATAKKILEQIEAGAETISQ